MNRFGIILFAILTYAIPDAMAQKKVPVIEGWRIHTSFIDNNDVCEAGNLVYVASTNALFRRNKISGELEVLSRASGLSDVKSTIVDYDPATQTVVVVYENTNIDLIQNGAIINIPEVLNQRIIGEKKINNITIKNSKAYLACSFGIVVIDLRKKKLVDSFANLGTNGSKMEIMDVEIFNDSVFIASQKGIFVCPMNNVNLSDYNNWKQNRSSLFSNHIELNASTLYAIIDSILMYRTGNEWKPVSGMDTTSYYNLSSANNKLVVSSRLFTRFIYQDGSWQNAPFISSQGGIISDENKFYAPQKGQYLIIADLQSGILDYVTPPGPQSSNAIRMKFGANNLWVAGGSVNGYATSSGWNSPLYRSSKFYRFNNNEWYSYNQISNPVINGGGDFVDVAIDPSNGHAILANFGTGIVEVSGNDIVQTYTEANSSLQKFITGTSYEPLLVSGVDFDNQNNLWVANYGAAKPISVRTPDNVWHSYSIPAGTDNRPVHFICDDYGAKWFINTRSQGILVFSENGTFDNVSDDLYRNLNEQKLNGYLPSNAVYCLAKSRDANGSIWVGTQKGLCIFNNPEKIFTAGEETDAKQLVIKTGLIYSNFLGDVPVYSIAVDAGNRKWIGTAQGVWLVSPDGYTVLNNFNTSNSPLLSNTVYSIGIDELTGEVFFGTENGMCSYMGTSTISDNEQSNVIAYPNPVKPGYSGLIAFKGLTENAYIKITDVAGNLIYETKANGGMATWNGITFQGNKAPAGVYLLFSTNEDGSQSLGTKFVILQ